MSDRTIPSLPYDPQTLPRELVRHYIPASEEDIRLMCAAIGVSALDELFRHIPAQVRMYGPLALTE
jgi:glycine cleavage system pyridoxal-binding protein P